MEEKLHLYFKNSQEWRDWLNENHQSSKGVYLIFYRVNSGFESMRWEEAVQVALCYGWIDSTVGKMDDDRRKQAFGPRKEKKRESYLGMDKWRPCETGCKSSPIRIQVKHKIYCLLEVGSQGLPRHTIRKGAKSRGCKQLETATRNTTIQYTRHYREGEQLL